MTVLLMVGPALGDDAVKSAEAKRLYQDAAKALQAKEIPQAAVSLTKLVQEFPQDELAPLAALHLAECELAQGQSTNAIKLLEQWLAPIAVSKSVGAIEPTATLRAQVLLARAYLINDDWHKVSEITSQALASKTAASPAEEKLLATLRQTSALAASRRLQSQATTLRQAADAVGRKQFSQALDTLAKVDAGELTQQWKWRFHVLRAQALAGTAKPNDALKELDQIAIDDLKPSESQSVRMLALDTAIAAGNLQRASKEIETLSVSAQTSDELSATVALRAVELAMLKKDRDLADLLAREGRQKYPTFALVHEFDFLRARNALARVEFDTARQILNQIIGQPPASDPTAVARAQWLLGESYMLSRDTSRAIAAYSAVIQDTRAPLWVESALVQRAKCYEADGDLAAAALDYRQLLERFPKSSLSLSARQRLDEILPTITSAQASATPANRSVDR